jgi:lambda family phage tail tape measure protein
MANMIARLGVVLGLDSAEFTKGIEAAGKKLEQFSQTAEKFGKIGATALVAASAAALQYADELADVAKANEVAIGTVLKLSNALANAGGKAGDTGKLLSSFTKFIDDAAGGSAEAQKTAKMLGVSLQDLGKLSEEELLNKVVKNLGSMEDSVTRNAKAMDVFGKAAKGVDFVSLAEDMDKANKLTDDQALGIQQAADAYDILAQNARNTMTVLASELGPVLLTTLNYIKDMKGDTNLLGNIFKTVFQTVAVLGANVAFVFKGIADELRHTYQNAKILVTEGIDAAILANKKYDAYRNSQRQNLDFFESQIMGTSYGRSGVDERRTDNKSPTASSGTRRNVIPARDKDAEEAERRRLKMIADLNREAQKYAKLLFDIEGQQVAAYTNEAKRIEKEQGLLAIKEQLLSIDILLRDMRPEDIQLTKDLFLAEQKRLDAVQEINRNNLLDADAKEQLIQRENELADATKRYAQAQNDAIKAQREGGFYEGFGKAANKFLRDMPTELEQGAKAFDSLMGNMESAIDRFVKTGKIGFKDLAKSIIQDMIAIQMKAAASNFLSSMFGSMFGMRANPYQPAAMTGVPGYADGGSPAVGQPSIVGERGPELFVPRTAGNIIPNHALSSMGGTTVVTNNYINAIDTKSFEERLYGSSNAIWAANQYANKSLAVNRGRA